jgi:hypothetical protein
MERELQLVEGSAVGAEPYDGQPSYVVSIMDFEGEKVIRETQYFDSPFEPGPSRARWVKRMD